MIWLGITIYWLGAAADFYTSKRMLVDHGGYHEANPVLAWMMQRTGVRTVLTVTKLAVFGVFLLIGAAWWAYLAMGVVMLGAGAWNYRLWRKKA